MNETVLVVDDELLVRDVVCQALRPEGFTVLEAGTGAGAEATCQQHAGAVHLLLAEARRAGNPMPHGPGLHSAVPGGDGFFLDTL